MSLRIEGKARPRQNLGVFLQDAVIVKNNEGACQHQV